MISGAANIFWGEPVMTGDNFTMFLRPWIAQAPKSFCHLGNDYTRFNVPYLQKWDCLAKPGEIYAVYLPKEGNVTIKLEPGSLHSREQESRCRRSGLELA